MSKAPTIIATMLLKNVVLNLTSALWSEVLRFISSDFVSPSAFVITSTFVFIFVDAFTLVVLSLPSRLGLVLDLRIALVVICVASIFARLSALCVVPGESTDRSMRVATRKMIPFSFLRVLSGCKISLSPILDHIAASEVEGCASKYQSSEA